MFSHTNNYFYPVFQYIYQLLPEKNQNPQWDKIKITCHFCTKKNLQTTGGLLKSDFLTNSCYGMIVLCHSNITLSTMKETSEFYTSVKLVPVSSLPSLLEG